MNMKRTIFLSCLLSCALCFSSLFSLTRAKSSPPGEFRGRPSIDRVLLLSVDGLHAVDLAIFVKFHPNSALAHLSNMGITYTNASTSKPSDSFPGLLSMTTGGGPFSTGVFYDDSFDRNLSPPGSNCDAIGTEVNYSEFIDKNPDALDAGGGIDPAKLPLDPSNGCTPVYPHSYLRVNTIFEVIRDAGLRTAWSDKHPSYEILNGPSGAGIDDLYTPEINANGITGSVAKTEAYDDLKVQAILNEINGKDHTGAEDVGVPAIFGMNFQAVSVGQKLASGGYADAIGNPSPSLQDALNHTDQSIGQMVDALRAQGLLSSTLIIVTAKHGQTPIDRQKSQIINDGTIPDLVNQVQPDLFAFAVQDDISLIWLRDQSLTEDVVEKLSANEGPARIDEILARDALKQLYRDPLKDSRTPDIIVLPNFGVIYAGSKSTKIAEHGGFNRTDTNVALLVSNPQFKRGKKIVSPVETYQIAPTILGALGLDPQSLQAVRIEKTQTLPGLNLSVDEDGR